MLGPLGLHGIPALPPVVGAYSSGQDMLRKLRRTVEHHAAGNLLSPSPAELLHAKAVVILSIVFGVPGPNGPHVLIHVEVNGQAAPN